MNPHTPPHTLVVPLADVTAGTAQNYMLTAGGNPQPTGHTHMLPVSAANFTTLKNTGSVTLMSSTDGHSHMVTLTC